MKINVEKIINSKKEKYKCTKFYELRTKFKTLNKMRRMEYLPEKVKQILAEQEIKT